jgi:hypothetical protein
LCLLTQARQEQGPISTFSNLVDRFLPGPVLAKAVSVLGQGAYAREVIGLPASTVVIGNSRCWPERVPL